MQEDADKKDKKKKKRKGFFGFTARALMLFAAGLLFFTYLSMIVDPVKAWFMTPVGLLFIPAVLLNLFLLLWSIRRLSKAGLIPLVALLPSLFFIGRYVQLSGPDANENDKENAVKIVTYNVGKFIANNMGMDIPTCEDSAEAYLRSLDADIICLQEYRIPAGNDVKKYLKKRFPGYYASYHVFTGAIYTFGNITLTKYPIKGEKAMDFESANVAVYTDLDINGERLRIYNCHFESYGLRPHIILSDIFHRREEEVREAEDKVKKSISKRSSQVEVVMDDIENCPTEAIVIGDFNDNPLSYTYHRLSKGKKDSFIEAGKGFGASYTMLWPFVRIDYVLYPKSLKAISHRMDKVHYSDHYPVITEIKIPAENNN